MMRSKLVLILLALTCNASAFEKEAREAWISKRADQLRAVADLSTVPLAGFATSDKERNKGGMFRYHAKRNGRVNFTDGTWVIFSSHSSHSEEGRREVLGDVTVARSSTGKIYVSYGHCCPWLTLDSPEKLETVADFLAAKGLVPEGVDGGWIEYEPEG